MALGWGRPRWHGNSAWLAATAAPRGWRSSVRESAAGCTRCAGQTVVPGMVEVNVFVKHFLAGNAMRTGLHDGSRSVHECHASLRNGVATNRVIDLTVRAESKRIQIAGALETRFGLCKLAETPQASADVEM